MYSKLETEESSELQVILDSSNEKSVVVQRTFPKFSRLSFVWFMGGLSVCLGLFAIVWFIFWNTSTFGENFGSQSWAAYFTTASDFVIAVSYFSIPGSLLYVVSKRKDLPFNWIFWLFAGFIVCCGITHLVQMFHNHLPSFFVNTIVKSITAIVSFTTAVVLIQLIPTALKVPSMQQLEDEIKERKFVQEKMVEGEKTRDKQRRETEEAKNLFFANMSHEIRTPLSGIIGLTDLLSRSTSLGEEERDLVRQITASGELLLGIVNDVLDVAKLDEGKIELEEIEFSPSQCIYSIESVLRVKALERGLKLIINMSEDFAKLRVIGDSARLKQALVNLGGNAIKFTNCGYVKIWCDVVEQRAQSTTIAVAIEDTGIGIPEDRMSRLFKTYTQVDASYSRNFGGTGLGLYIAKEFVELLGGSISVRSKVNEGTTFTVTVPFFVSKRPKEAEAPTPVLLPDSFRGATDKAILVVDDNTINQSVALKMLAHFGFTNCDKAENGEQALLFMKAKRYDLVLMDCMMPVMDGYQATKEWRRYEQDQHVPHITIVGVTANALKQDEALCLRSGMDKYARKPLSRKALGEILAKCFCNTQQ